jgi:hypothetical protein
VIAMNRSSPSPAQIAIASLGADETANLAHILRLSRCRAGLIAE